MKFGTFKFYCMMYEAASSCDFPTIAGPIPQDKRPIGGARKPLNLRKMARKRKKLPPEE